MDERFCRAVEILKKNQNDIRKEEFNMSNRNTIGYLKNRLSRV